MSQRFHNLSQHFSDIVERYGEKEALCFGSHGYSYDQLNNATERAVAGLIRWGGVESGVVALPASKQFEVYVVLLACLKLGVPYSFYDTQSPPDRVLAQMGVLDDPLVVIDDGVAHALQEALQADHTCCEIKLLLEDGEPQAEAMVGRVGDTSIAYIMFTSGSTGVPKGVSISHGNLLYLISWIENCVQVVPEDRVSGLNKQYFDNSVFDLYGSLFTGATLYPVADELLIDSARLFQYLVESKITVWFSVPSLLVYHLSVASRQVASLRTIRKIIFGGEAFPKSSLRQLWELYRNHPVALINVYGPTECTCICSIYRISEEDFSEENMVQIAPIGVISDYFDYAIVDEHNRPVECGVVGELILGGGAVGKGYWGREDLSEKVFISNPSSPLLNDRYYKSGDLVRARRTGELEFVSRVDYQIKHMGHRIELPEIESVILAESAVVEACAIYKTGGNSGFIQLYYHGEVDEDFVITLLEKKLPTYMRPRVVVRVDELPKNRNGKVDRKQLGEE